MYNIGFIAGKLGDVDGVSLEVDKWINVLQGFGHQVYTLSGRYGGPLEAVPEENRFTDESLRFDSPFQRALEQEVFPHLGKLTPHVNSRRRKRIIEELKKRGAETANRLFEFIYSQGIDVLIAENTNAMPMTLLGGMAVYQLAVNRRVATIFHHHDFWWERSRFSHSRIEPLLTRTMPPADPGLEHVVLSSYAAHILRSLKHVQPKVIPNCEDFEHPVVMDEYNGDFRKELGFSPRDILVLQPTRMVPRKRIEDSIALCAALAKDYPDLAGRIHLVVSLGQGDEPDTDYSGYVADLAEKRGVPLHLIASRVGSRRGMDTQGRKIYTNRDVLAHADLVTYLPIWEGFGNALLEALAARVPVVTTTYLVYKTDIRGTLLRNIEIRDVYGPDGGLVIPRRALEEIHYVLTNPEERKIITDRNSAIAGREFGLETLRCRLKEVLEDYSDEIKASRRRIRQGGAFYSV
ncbi:MAG: glycosyltransferase family 4 protein [Spirochaetales bacterium]|nr:glycosyltransferase family 4 protein [Spirochaetales bacterium]